MANPTRQKILIVDDEQDILDFLEMLLEDHGYDVCTASNGKLALEKAKEYRPDLITLDLTMPKHSGIKSYHQLKSDSKLSHIPVIIITGIPGKLRDFLSDNGDVPMPEAYFEKPLDRTLFLEKIASILH